MCIVDKFFFCVPLHLGCLILGVFTFILSSLMAAESIALLVIEDNAPGTALHYLKVFPHLVFNSSSFHFILVTVAILAVLWMAFSLLLLVGVWKNRAGFLLSFFGFSFMMTILVMLSALLLLLQQHWILALVDFMISMFYLHALIVVHSTYDLMQANALFKSRDGSHASDEDILVISMSE